LDTQGYELLLEQGLVPFPLFVVPQVRDSTGAVVSGLPILYTSLDSTVATINRRTGEVTLLQPGQVRFVAETNAYGIVRVDTVTYTITRPVIYDVWVDMDKHDLMTDAFGGPLRDIRIPTSGMVLWFRSLFYGGTDTVDVVFDDPTNVVPPPEAVCIFNFRFNRLPSSCAETGNVQLRPGFFNSAFQIRQFPVPGTYTYHSPQFGIQGRIVVGSD